MDKRADLTGAMIMATVIMLLFITHLPISLINYVNAQTFSSSTSNQREALVLSNDFESGDSLIGWTVTFTARLSGNKHFDYLVSPLSERDIFIEGRIIPGSSTPYMPLNSSESEKALKLFQEHFRVTDADKFSGNSSLLIDLSSDVDYFTIEKGFDVNKDLIVLRFAIKLEGSRETFRDGTPISMGVVFGPDGAFLMFNIIGYGTNRTAFLHGEKEGSEGTTALFTLKFGQWYEIEMIVNRAAHSYCILVDGSYGVNGPYSSSDLSTRKWDRGVFRLEFNRGRLEQLKIYLDDVKVSTLSARMPSIINISANPTKILLGSVVHVFGMVSPHPANVSIEISKDGGNTWTKLAEVRTMNGMFHYEWAPSDIGVISLRAYWPGDIWHLEAISSVINLAIEESLSISMANITLIKNVPHMLNLSQIDSSLSVLSITLITNGTVKDLTITIQESYKPPKGAPPPIGTIYRYYVISKSNNLTSVSGSITFKVQKSWLQKNGVKDASSIVLLHLQDDRWQQLPTTFVGEDEDYAYYEAKFSSLSIFVVVIPPSAGSSILGYLIVGMLIVFLVLAILYGWRKLK
jgi:PGF-pre-PGF domain-containing protein